MDENAKAAKAYADLHDHSSHLIVGGRRAGKTTKLLQWLKKARRRHYYPFWDRVLLVHSTNRAQDLRIKLRQEAEARGAVDSDLYYNLVYSFKEWETIRLGGEVEIAVDDIDMLINMHFGRTPRLIALYARQLRDRDPGTI